jgi:hypothetical protein
MAASKETEELFLVEVSSAVAVQAVAAAKGSDLGDGGSSVQMSQRHRSRVARIRRKVFWVWLLEDEAEEDSASGSMHDVPSAEHASGGGMILGGQRSGVGVSGGPTKPTVASTETEEPFLVGASTSVAIQTAAAAKESYDDGGGTAGAYAINA